MCKVRSIAGGSAQTCCGRAQPWCGNSAIEVEDALPLVTQPVLVLAGRYDRTCIPAASERIAGLIPGSQLHIFEQSGHMTFVEQEQEYVDVVRRFLDVANA